MMVISFLKRVDVARIWIQKKRSACLVHVIWIQIQNHRVPQKKKKMFGTRFLSEDWNPNLNFMWVPCQIWVQPFTYFWIQAGFKSEPNSYGFQFIIVTGPTFFFSSHFLSLSLLQCFSASLFLALRHFTAISP